VTLGIVSLVLQPLLTEKPEPPWARRSREATGRRRRLSRKDCDVSSPLLLPFFGVAYGACETEGDEGCVIQAIDCPVWKHTYAYELVLRSG
jgi:hypothetical protein